MVSLAWAASSWAGPPSASGGRGEPAKKPKSAEASRWSTPAFREGLRRRGLTELLDLHLRDFPPAGRLASLTMRRDLRLSEFADVNLSPAERARAIAAANRILEEIIEEGATDQRRFQWRFDLIHSLIYDEAEPFFSSILYRGGSAQDRSRLQALTTRALAAADDLSKNIVEEYERIDDLSIRQFEQLEQSGAVKRLDALAPQSEYLLLWVLLYDTIGRAEDDPYRASRLNRILTLLEHNPILLTAAHERSHVQVQSLLLAGMTHRLINDHAAARDLLVRAISIADGLTDVDDRSAVQWAVTLAYLESVRNERDAEDFERAGRRLDAFSAYLTERHQGQFGLLLVRALLARSVLTRQAMAARRDRMPVEAARFDRRAWQELLTLQRQHPARIDEINSAIYSLIGDDDEASLDPFEVSALVAGLLTEGDADAADARLDRAIALGERFVAGADREMQPLVPGVLYNVAVALYRRDRPADAAARFMEVARRYRDFPGARQAAVFAVQLASSFYQDERLREAADVQALYLDALEALVGGFPDSDDAQYWRFFLAQHLQETGRFSEALAHYSAVMPDHERFLPGLLRRLQCMKRLIERPGDAVMAGGVSLPPSSPTVPSPVGPSPALMADRFSDLQRELMRRIYDAMPAASDGAERRLLQSLAARSRLLDAEVQVLPAVDRGAVALERLTGFEKAFPGFTHLAGRVWRVRLVALEQLGRLDEAAGAIPAYIAADPDHAGAMLQTLYTSVQKETEKLERLGDERGSRRKAQVALILAEQVHQWSVARPDRSTEKQRRQLLIQLAGANIAAQQYERAKELYEQCGARLETEAEPEGGANDPLARASTDNPISMDAVIEHGYAEALFQLEQYGPALIKFNRLARSWPPGDSRRTQALLRDLQCRAKLNKPPKGIIRVIEQQQFLHPEIKNSRFAKAFEKLLRENQRRLDGR